MSPVRTRRSLAANPWVLNHQGQPVAPATSRRDLVLWAITEHGRLLDGRDEVLLRAVIVDGKNYREAAALVGLSDSGARRRTLKLVRRLAGFDFRYAARTRHTWPPRDAAVAACCLIRGMSIRQAAAELGISPTITRRIRERVITRVEGARTMYDLCRRQLRGEVAS